MLVAGLTGGIASGKSTVADMFETAGALIVDADRIARDVVVPESSAWREIKSIFGDQVIRSDGSLDRLVLGDMVFNDIKLRKLLEGIVHPIVRDRMAREVERLADENPKGLIIKDIPLLFETGMTDGLAEIIVVYVPFDKQLKRLMKRDGVGSNAARSRVNAQMPLEEKRRLGTLVIDNSGDLSDTKDQVLKIYNILAKKARETDRPDNSTVGPQG